MELISSRACSVSPNAFHRRAVRTSSSASMSGPPMAEHRAGVPQTACLVEQQAMLFCGPHATGCTFRAQSQAVAIAVVECIHFFFDDIGHFTDRALEQLGVLYHRHTDFLIAVLAEHLSYRGLYILPDRGLVREDVIHPPDCLNFSQV